MKLFPCAIALFFTLGAGGAHAADPCATQNNTLEINACAEAQFDAQDKRLNEAYRTLLNALPDTNDPGISGDSPRRMLIKAQRKWLEFRDADCGAKYQLYAGGTIRNWTQLNCLRERTEQRVKELAEREWLQGG